MTDEVPLVGGMDPRWAPVRVGNTVRRPAGSSGDAVRDLLLHLEAVGFDGAPRHLGTDEQGREVLSWVDGDVPLPPYPAWSMTDRALADLGGLIRRYHEAASTYRPPADADWATDWADPTRGAGHPSVTICHNDLFPENVVFRDGRVVALIDFAMAAPGRALWDVAIAAEMWGPLGDPERRDQHPLDLDGIARVGVLARGYGLAAGRRRGAGRRPPRGADPHRRQHPRGDRRRERSWIGNWAAAGGDERAAAAKPTATVARARGLSPASGPKRVLAARKAGLLPETEPGKPAGA